MNFVDFVTSMILLAAVGLGGIELGKIILSVKGEQKDARRWQKIGVFLIQLLCIALYLIQQGSVWRFW